MSIPRKMKASCPNCGSEITFTMWISINTDMEFALPDILSGKLFQIRCGNCGYETRADYPILFNDMVHKMVIQYAFPDAIAEAEKTCRELMQYGPRARIVTSQNELREKAAILNDGLDDRLVEILKYLMLPSWQKQLPGHTIKHL